MKRTLLSQRRQVISSAHHHHRHRRHRHSTDAALLWAKANPQQAQVSLQPPPFPISTNPRRNTPNNWSEFWNWRNWNFSSSSFRAYEEALVSHVLTGPLTLAHHHHHAHSNVQHWTCLGARAESMLPVPYWKEFLYYRHAKIYPFKDDDEAIIRETTLISFVGPECENVPSQQQLTWNDHSSLTLEWSFRGKYHDMPSTGSSSSSSSSSSGRHGFVLFNPGFAHPHLQKDWRPTLEKLWNSSDSSSSSSSCCFVLTAHSAADAERDWKLWHAFDSTIPPYEENPWASQITYADPVEGTSITIRPNAYVCHHAL